MKTTHALLFVLLAASFACSKKADEPPAQQKAPPAMTAPDPAMFGVSFDLDAGRAPSKIDDLPPDAPFEGTIHASAKVVDDDAPEREVRPAHYDFTLKDARVRWDLFADAQANAGWRVWTGDARLFYTVNPRGSVVYVTSEASLAGDAGARRDFHLAAIAMNPKGRVAGHDCERWEGRDDAHRYEMCVAKGLVPFPLHLLGGALGDVVPFNAELEEKGLFPLSATRYPASGDKRRPDRIYSVTEIARRRVAPENFRIPDEFPKVPRATLQPGRVLL